jgi:hypothetical protein
VRRWFFKSRLKSRHHMMHRLARVFLSFMSLTLGRLRLKRDGTRTETRFRLSAKRTSPFKSAGASVQSTTGSRGVRIIGSNAGCTMFRGSVKGTGYPLHSPVSPSLPLPCVTVCHYISTELYELNRYKSRLNEECSKFFEKGCKLNCNGYGTRAKLMETTRTV